MRELKGRGSFHLQYGVNSTADIALVKTPFVEHRDGYINNAKKALGRDNLTPDERNRCERRAAISAAPEWQGLHERIYTEGVNAFKQTVKRLGGTV
jgi:hypothetical protein